MAVGSIQGTRSNVFEFCPMALGQMITMHNKEFLFAPLVNVFFFRRVSIDFYNAAERCHVTPHEVNFVVQLGGTDI